MSSNTLKLPKAVREAQAAAERTAVELGMKGAPGAEPGTPAAQAEATATPAQPAAPAEQPRERIDPEDWKTRFSNYKRETDQTISELRQTNGSLQQQIADMQRQQSALIERLTAAEAKPANTPAVSGSGGQFTIDMIPEEIRDQYDDEFLGAVVKVAQLVSGSSSQSVPSDIVARLNQIEASTSKLNTVAVKTAQQLFYDALDGAVPEWERIGQDQQWYDWLKATQINPPFDRRTAQDVYEQAMEGKEAEHVIALLKRFKAETGWAISGTINQQSNLNSRVTPDGAAPGGTLSSDLGEGAGVWTESAINQFHTDITKGRYRGREAEAQRISNEIQLAFQQGKVVPG